MSAYARVNRLSLTLCNHSCVLHQYTCAIAGQNCRKKRRSPEAIEQLVPQGLSGNAAVPLVTQVVTELGLKSYT